MLAQLSYLIWFSNIKLNKYKHKQFYWAKCKYKDGPQEAGNEYRNDNSDLWGGKHEGIVIEMWCWGPPSVCAVYPDNNLIII